MHLSLQALPALHCPTVLMQIFINVVYKRTDVLHSSKHYQEICPTNKFSDNFQFKKFYLQLYQIHYKNT